MPASSANWTHFNAVTYNADLDQVIVSLRNFSEIWILSGSFITGRSWDGHLLANFVRRRVAVGSNAGHVDVRLGDSRPPWLRNVCQRWPMAASCIG